MALGGYAGASLVFLVATVSSLYIIAVVRSFSVGLPRLAAAIPVFAAYFALPPLAADPRVSGFLSMILSTHFSWWANFKVLALCFGQGPLVILEPGTLPVPPQIGKTASEDSTTSLKQPTRDSQKGEGLRQRKSRGEGADSEGKTTEGAGPVSKREWPNYWGFTAILVLPLVIAGRSTAGGKWQENAGTPWPIALFHALVSLALFWLIVYALDFSPVLPEMVVDVLYIAIMYLFMVFMFGCSCALVQACSGIRLASHFNAPFLSTSLIDFWGRRWNRVAGQLLRDSTYRPIKLLLVHHTPLGRTPAVVPHMLAVFLTFVISGLMHELILYNAAGHFNGATFEWTAFFLIHAVGVVFEGCLWEVGNRYSLRPLPRIVTMVWTLLFFLLTTPRLFFAPLKRTGLATLTLSDFRRLMPGESLMSLIDKTS